MSLKGFLNKSGSVTLSKGQTQKHGGLCPVGHKQLAAQNRTELLHIAEQHHEAGGGLLFGTLTMQTDFTTTPDFYSRDEDFRSTSQFHEMKHHTKGNAADRKAELTLLREEFDAVTERDDSWQAWETAARIEAVKDGVSKAFAGKAWSQDSQQLGVIGRATTLEFVITPSAEGWGSVKTHVHVHYLLFTQQASHLPEAIAKVKARISARWMGALARYGFTASAKRQELKQVTQSVEDFRNIAAYLTKGSAGEDGIFSALAYAQANHADSDDALNFFRNLENAMKGTHLFRATPSLKNTYGVPDLRAAQKKERIEHSNEVFAALIPSAAAEEFLSEGSPIWDALQASLAEGDLTRAERLVASRFGQVRESAPEGLTNLKNET